MSVFAGLCASCRHMRPVRSRSGSLFRFCLLSREDPRFPRYPNLPVLECSGYVEGDPEDGNRISPAEGEGRGSHEETRSDASGSTGSGSKRSGRADEDSAESEPEARRGDSEEVRPEFDSAFCSPFGSVFPSTLGLAPGSPFTFSTPTPRSR